MYIFGHPGWKAIDARAGFSVVNAVLYLVLFHCTGLTSVPDGSDSDRSGDGVLLVYVGFAVTDTTFQSVDKVLSGDPLYP